MRPQFTVERGVIFPVYGGKMRYLVTGRIAAKVMNMVVFRNWNDSLLFPCCLMG